ncbi:MAG: 50S ribosomal protein L5, partial [Candidatus Gracilibacteria bacterium]
SKKAISNFKLKINMATGVVVTLRGKRMYDFINKLVNVVFPRIRDFRGISTKSFDGRGNYSLGIREHTIFPEIRTEDVNKIHGLQVTIQTTAKNNADALKLLKAFEFPFIKNKAKTN